MKTEFLLCYFFSVTWAVSTRNVTFARDSKLEWGPCDPQNRLLSIQNQSLLSCCVICKSKPTCEGVCFNELNKTCVLQRGRYITEPTVWKDTNMTHYYLMTDEEYRSSKVQEVVMTTEQEVVMTTELSVSPTSTALSVQSNTPSSFDGYRTIEFQNHTYIAVTKKMVWIDAETACKKFGDHTLIVSIDSDEEADFLMDRAMKFIVYKLKMCMESCGASPKFERGDNSTYVSACDRKFVPFSSWVKTKMDFDGNTLRSGEPGPDGNLVCAMFSTRLFRVVGCEEKYQCICEKPNTERF